MLAPYNQGKQNSFGWKNKKITDTLGK